MADVSENDTVPRKRKRIDIRDYFSASVSTQSPAKLRCQQLNNVLKTTPCTATTTTTIPGLKLLPEFLNEQEEQDLLQFLDAQRWRTDLSRRVIHYGGTYCLMPPRNATPEQRKQIESTIYDADPVPPEINFVIARMIEHGIFTGANRPEYCIVNSYTSNQGISAHVENFRFDSPVCGLTLLNGDWMRFHELAKPDDGSVRSGKAVKAERTGRRVDIWMPRRSLLVMSGDARERWQHEIVRRKKDRTASSWRRVSLTFRTLKKPANTTLRAG